uniref:Phosphatidylinositol transfer protein cytoplasmic 1 n=1 Tax=Oncorhynchus kisutch TaxID=8019 RepID=A0A8C7GL29_ONCKI
MGGGGHEHTPIRSSSLFLNKEPNVSVGGDIGTRSLETKCLCHTNHSETKHQFQVKAVVFPPFSSISPETFFSVGFVLQCSFLPKFSIHIETKYEDNKGSNDNIFSDSENKDQEREVCFVDIAYDEIPERYYKESEDLRYFKSEKTSRGMLQEGWRDTQEPIMCSYKLVTVKFEVWGLQTRVEQFVHKVVRDVLLLGHRQAFAWVDEWIDMNLDDVREYEKSMHEQTNIKVCHEQQEHSTNSPSLDDIEIHDKASVCVVSFPLVLFHIDVFCCSCRRDSGGNQSQF